MYKDSSKKTLDEYHTNPIIKGAIAYEDCDKELKELWLKVATRIKCNDNKYSICLEIYSFMTSMCFVYVPIEKLDSLCKYKIVYRLNNYLKNNEKDINIAYLKPIEDVPEEYLENFVRYFNQQNPDIVEYLKIVPLPIEEKKNNVVSNMIFNITVNNSHVGDINNVNNIVNNNNNNIDNSINKVINNFIEVDKNRHLLNHEFSKSDYDLSDLYKKLHMESPYPNNIDSTSSILHGMQAAITHDPLNKSYFAKTTDNNIMKLNDRHLDFPFKSKDDKNNITTHNLLGFAKDFSFSLITPENVNRIQDIKEYESQIKNAQFVKDMTADKLNILVSILDKYQTQCKSGKSKTEYNLQLLFECINKPEFLNDKEKLESIIGPFPGQYQLTHGIRQMIKTDPKCKYETRYDTKNKAVCGSSRAPLLFMKENL